jgi:hypothetical protein
VSKSKQQQSAAKPKRAMLNDVDPQKWATIKSAAVRRREPLAVFVITAAYQAALADAASASKAAR